MHQDINFYQGAFRRQAPFFSAAFMAQALAAALLTMLLGYGYAWQRTDGLQAELVLLAQQEAQAIERLEKLRPIIAAVTGERSLAELLDDALRTLDEKQTVLALINGTALGDTQGFSRHLRALARQNVAGLWLTQITLSGTGKKTGLRGRARQPELVPAYVQNLAGERPFSTQRFQQFQINRPDEATDGTVEFSMNSEPSSPTGLASVR
jgi:hypothetical protein